MSNSQASGHIPDLDLITHYSENCYSFLTRISPWTKLFGLIAIIVILTISQSVELLMVMYAFILLIYWQSNLPIRKLVNWCFLPVLFVLSLVILLMWNEPGIPLLSLKIPWFSLTLTDNGLLLLIRLLLKALISMTSSLLFLMTTRYSHLSAIVYRIFPYPVDQIFLMSYRFLFITLDMIDSMIMAFKSRGGGFIKNMSRQTQTFAEIFALVFIRSYDQAERVNKAMESRGYNGTYTTSTEIQQIRPVEYTVLFAFLIAIAYLLIFYNSSISR